ncbi:MAG: hypothetical protein Fues2KO_37060 [Fuerstiella sp.]
MIELCRARSLGPQKATALFNHGSSNPWPTSQAGTSPMSADTESSTPLDAEPCGAFCYRMPGFAAFSFPVLKIAGAIKAGVLPGLSATGKTSFYR